MKSKTRIRHSLAQGFTLIEFIAVMVVVGVIAVIGGNIFRGAFMAYFGSKDLVQADAQVKVALERMARELKDIRSASATDLPTFTASAITFVDVNGNTIAYALSGTTLNRTLNAGAAQPLADNISSLAFSYLRRDGQTAEPAAGTAANVYYITYRMTVAKTTASQSYRGTVKPRAF